MAARLRPSTIVEVSGPWSLSIQAPDPRYFDDLCSTHQCREAGVQGSSKGGTDADDYYESCWEGKPILTWEEFLALDQEQPAAGEAA